TFGKFSRGVFARRGKSSPAASELIVKTKTIVNFTCRRARDPKSQFPNSREIQIAKFQIRHRDHSLFEIIDEKIKVNSRASVASVSRATVLLLVNPASTSRRNSRLSFASLRQIFTRIRKSFLLSASSASIQFAATEPDARTNCRTSSVLLTVLGNCLTNARTDSANRNVRSSRSRAFAPASIFEFGI